LLLKAPVQCSLIVTATSGGTDDIQVTPVACLVLVDPAYCCSNINRLTWRLGIPNLDRALVGLLNHAVDHWLLLLLVLTYRLNSQPHATLSSPMLSERSRMVIVCP
jgi:hypothetical protein